MVTISCANKMNSKYHIWTEIRQIITKLFDKIQSTSDDLDNIMFCFNIHNNGAKILSSIYDTSDTDNWIKWRLAAPSSSPNGNDFPLPQSRIQSAKLKSINFLKWLYNQLDIASILGLTLKLFSFWMGFSIVYYDYMR